MTAYYSKGIKIIAAYAGKHGCYSVLSYVRDSLCFNSKDRGEMGRLPGIKGVFTGRRNRSDVVTHARKHREAL